MRKLLNKIVCIILGHLVHFHRDKKQEDIYCLRCKDFLGIMADLYSVKYSQTKNPPTPIKIV